MDEFTKAYIEAALWSSNDNSDPNTGGDPLDANYSMENIASESLHKMEADCVEFQRQNARYLDGFYDAGYKPDQAGHDFWLTRNGHGSGFWDENAPKDVITALTQASKKFGEQSFFVDRGMLVLEGGHQPGTQKPLFSSKASLLKKADPNEGKIIEALRARPMSTGELEKLCGGGKYSHNAWPAITALKDAGRITQKQMRWHLNASLSRNFAITGRRQKVARGLSVPERHQLRIAIDSMNMEPAMLGVMGGPSVDEARKIIKQLTGREFEQLPKSMQRPSWRRTGSIPAMLRSAHSLAPGTTAAGEEKQYPKVEYRKYRCLNCGHEQPIQTNHVGKVIDYCKECSWKPSFRGNPEHHKMKEDGMSIDFNGRTYRPFEYVGPWDFSVDKEDRSKTVDPYSHPPTKASLEKTAMTRKDYILIADILKSMNMEPAVQDIAQKFAVALKQDNSMFNAEHFLAVVTGKKELTSRPPRMASKTAEWSDDPEFPNWQREVAEGNTRLGFEEWLEHMIEAGNITIDELPVQPAPRSLPLPGDIKLPHESSHKARLAGAKVSYNAANYIQEAKRLIDNDDPMIYDVAADTGQIVGNVKHMSWFVQEVAEWLAESEQQFGAGDGVAQ